MDYKSRLKYLDIITSVRNYIKPTTYIKKIELNYKVINRFNLVDAGKLEDEFVNFDVYVFTTNNNDFDFNGFINLFRRAKKELLVLMNIEKTIHYFDEFPLSINEIFPFFDVYFDRGADIEYWLYYTESY